MEWYCLDIKAALEKLTSSEKGLSEQEARDRLEKFGRNRIEPLGMLSNSVDLR